MAKSRWEQYKEKNGVTPLDLLNPATKKASDELANFRMSICQTCPELFTPTTQCKKCGCFMQVKTKFEAAKCPLDKWNTELPKTNLVIIPSRQRPHNVEIAVAALKTHSKISDIVIGLDEDDESIYPRIEGVIYEVNPRLKMNGTLNLIANKYANQYQTICFLGDDHVVRTPEWDITLYSSLKTQGYGISYGNDLLQGKNLPTAVMMTTNIIKSLGFMSPPELIHMFMDNFWLRIGTELNSVHYFEDVVIEHMWYGVGKSEHDEMYKSVNNAEVGTHDGQAIGKYFETKLESAVKKLKEDVC
jgi:hypothetical protein